MLLHDRVTVTVTTETGEYDSLGRPIVEEAEHRIPAQVDPATTTSGDDPNASQVISRYRVLMQAPEDLDLTSVSEVQWRGRTIRVDGEIQPQMLRGRIHHHEFVSERVSG